MASPTAADYIETKKNQAQDPDLVRVYTQIADFYRRRLWHQLTQTLESFVKLPRFQQGTELIEFYENFIKDFEGRINQLKFIQMIMVISQQYQDINQAINFVEQIAKKVQQHQDASILVRSVLASKKLKSGATLECKISLG